MTLKEIVSGKSSEPISQKARRRLEDLLGQVEELISAGQDVFLMNRMRLSQALGVRQTVYQLYYVMLATELERRYARTPVFATPQRAELRKEYTNRQQTISGTYGRLIKACPKLRPSVSEIMHATGMPRETVVQWCERLQLAVDSSHAYAGARHLIRGLANISPDKFIADSVLAKKFPGEDMRQIRKYINISYKSGFLPKSARPYVLLNNIIYNLLRGHRPSNAVRFSGITSKDLDAVIEIAETRWRVERRGGARGSYRTKTIVEALRRVDSAR